MGLGEDAGKVIVTVADALTPRSIRVLLVFLVALNGYGWWRHDSHLVEQDKAIAVQAATIGEFKAEVAKTNLQLQYMNSKAEEGNQELKAIRLWLMNRGR